MLNLVDRLGLAVETMLFSLKISLNFITPIAASPIQWGFFYGLAVSALLAMSGYLALRWARNRSPLMFLWVLVGGFIARLAVFGIALVWAWKFSRFDAKVFTWTLLISYLVFQFIETVVFQRYFKRIKP
ncbi:hypothetical protein L0337_26130 [candidate division KSB1 bacterium]|nr:hypothetical protein [candidate division KSB1 bacterium]